MDDGQLIQLVCTYPHLYDKKKAAFKDARKRMVSWQEIARRLGYSGKISKHKLSNLYKLV